MMVRLSIAIVALGLLMAPLAGEAQRADKALPLVVIPDTRNDERLKREVVVAWWRVLGVPLDEFGLDEEA